MMDIETLTIEERVENGVAFLDQVAIGWEHRINLQTLRLWACSSCVLGQVFGDYTDAVRIFDIEEIEARALGFMAGAEDPVWTRQQRDTDEDVWDLLEDEWRRVIIERRGTVG